MEPDRLDALADAGPVAPGALTFNEKLHQMGLSMLAGFADPQECCVVQL